MIHSLSLERFSKSRVWLDEVPENARMRGFSRRLYRSTGQKVEFSRHSAAVEWHIPMGARSLYGLLGVVCEPSDGEFVIDIIDEFPNRKYEESIAPSVFDCQRVGLSFEYRDSVVGGILRGVEGSANGVSARLLISSSVVGETSSSRAMFENLGRVVVRLLCTKGELSDSELRAIVVYG
jgi:hypothetical protein